MAFVNPQIQRELTSSSSSRGWNYDAFLSFRGEDTRNNFTDHLYKALVRERIHTFRDSEELRRGEEIGEFLKVIEESRIYVLILSENYANSSWCLDELAKIMDCKKQLGKLVFPIFYRVQPNDVLQQRGRYGKAFADHESRNGDDEGRRKIERWREALKMVGNIGGWTLRDRSELSVIEEITSTIWKCLNRERFHVEKNLVGRGRGRGSSTSTSTDPWDYEVYISFQAEDTRYNFTDYLYAALYQTGIRTFREEELMGEEIETSIFKAIEKSRCILVIFSQNYANSRSLLGELVKITECKNQNGKLIIPIFYHIDPSDVRNQLGSYQHAFDVHEGNSYAHKTEKWRKALRLVANLSGWHVQYGIELMKKEANENNECKIPMKANIIFEGRSEADAIEEITGAIFGRLSQKVLYVEEGLVGMDFGFIEMIMQMIKPLSSAVHMVGIHGLGGIGKTTIAKVLFNNIASDFMVASFIADVRESSKRNGLLYLQKQLLRDSSIRNIESVSNVDEAIPIIKARLCFKKVLLVLDDVDNWRQMEALAGDRSWFGPGSIIIVTTREKHLLEEHNMNISHELKKLDVEESIELFSWHAFNQNHPKERYETLSKSVVHYLDGLPLGLTVLGHFLRGKSVGEWESELHKLEQEPNQEIQGVLRRSYDDLDRIQKQIFLDVACFFNGEDKDFVIRILDACNFHAEGGIRVLSDKCLITILDNKIWMHDLIQQMGRDIVRQESPEDPGKWSRLCYPEVVSRVLTRKMGTEAIKGILFNLSIHKRTRIATESFVMMKNLRLLKFHFQLESSSVREDDRVQLSKDFEFPSYELRYFYWQGYPLESLPSSFLAEDLVELDMCYSSLKQLWGNDLIFEKLNTIRLSCSQHLKEVPDISISAPNLEKLILDGCSSLLELHPSIGKLRKLILLSLKNCKKLSSFPSISNMEALKILDLSRCSGLKKFPDIQGNLEHLLELYLDSTAIEEIPSSIKHLTGLVLLDLKRCKNLRSLPSGVCKLECLEYLFLSGCSKLENFPEMMEDMENLKELLLDGTSIEGLPLSIDRLKGLVLLNLRNCKNLVSLPKGMCKLASLETLIVSGCSQLNNLPRNIGSLQHLAQLHADGTAITQPPESIVLLRNLQVLMYPGSKILAPTSLGSLFSFWLLPRNSSNGIGLRLPSGFSSFRYCTNVNLSDSKLIEGAIPNGISSLISLKKLDLSRNNFLSIPAGISKLTNLKDLRLSQHKGVTEILELPPNAGDLDAHNCTALRPDSSSVSTLQGLQFLFYNCSKPVEDQSSNDASSSASTSPVVMQKFLETVAFSIVFPGTVIPEWIWRRNEGSSVRIELPTDWYNDDFLGFALCSVLEHLPERVICHFSSDVFDYGDLKDFSLDFQWTGNNVTVGSEHVWLCYQPRSQLRLLQFNDPNDWNHIEISFEAVQRFKSSAANVVVKCGVCLIYAEDLEGIHE